MPTQNGLRLHHLGRTNKARPDPGHRYEKGAISAAQSKKGGRARFLRENRNLQLGYAPNSPASECLRVTCRGTTAFTFTATFVSRSTTRSTGASNSYLNQPDSKFRVACPDRSPGTRRVSSFVPNPCRVGGLIIPWSCSCHRKQNSRPESESFISHSAVTFPLSFDNAPCFEEFVINS